MVRRARRRRLLPRVRPCVPAQPPSRLERSSGGGAPQCVGRGARAHGMIRRGTAGEGQWKLARAERIDACCTSPSPTLQRGSSLRNFNLSAYGTARAISPAVIEEYHAVAGPVTPPTSPESPDEAGDMLATSECRPVLTPQQLREPLLMVGLRIEEFDRCSDFIYTGENSQHLPALAPNARYLPPVGWTKLGLRTTPAADGENWVQSWHVAYHAPKNCRQIIVQTIREGFRVEDGSRFGSRTGSGVKDPRPAMHHVYPGVAALRERSHPSGVYCSPDIEYTQRRVQLRHSAIGDGLMIECRVRPGSYQQLQVLETENRNGGSDRPICKATTLRTLTRTRTAHAYTHSTRIQAHTHTRAILKL